MKVHSLELNGLKLIELKVHGDSRGFFVERFNEREFQTHGLPTHFAQDNHSRSAHGILRGLHYQTNPAQGKLVGVTRGKIWDVAVDIRRDSSTFGKHFAVELSDENGLMMWVPAGFAHGFCVTSDSTTDVLYKVDTLYSPQTEGGIAWNDPELEITWPVSHPSLSARDQKQTSFADYCKHPAF